MAKKNASTTTNLAEHSRAKVQIVTMYVSIYLNILERVPRINEVHILDLMCGEGVYEHGEKGSAVALVEKAIEHVAQSGGDTKNRIKIWLNDNGPSDIETNL